MESNKTLKYVDTKSPLKNILLIVFIIAYLFMFYNSIEKEVLILSLALIISILWHTFYTKSYHINKFVLQGNKVKIQSNKALKICNLNADLENIQNFQVIIDANCKRFFGGMFGINIKIDLKNGQSYEFENRTNRTEFLRFIPKIVKEVPDLKVFVNSNFDKGEYSKENLEYYLHYEKYPNGKKSFHGVIVGFIVVLGIMILAFISMFLH